MGICYKNEKDNFKYTGVKKYSPSDNAIVKQKNDFKVLKFKLHIISIKLTNKDFEHTNNVSIIEKLINVSLEKYKELYKRYEYRIHPLTLIQIWNKKEGEIIKVEIEKELGSTSE